MPPEGADAAGREPALKPARGVGPARQRAPDLGREPAVEPRQNLLPRFEDYLPVRLAHEGLPLLAVIVAGQQRADDSFGPVEAAPEDVVDAVALVEEGAEVAHGRARQLINPALPPRRLPLRVLVLLVNQQRGVLGADAEDLDGVGLLAHVGRVEDGERDLVEVLEVTVVEGEDVADALLQAEAGAHARVFERLLTVPRRRENL